MISKVNEPIRMPEKIQIENPNGRLFYNFFIVFDAKVVLYILFTINTERHSVNIRSRGLGVGSGPVDA